MLPLHSLKVFARVLRFTTNLRLWLRRSMANLQATLVMRAVLLLTSRLPKRPLN